jgi:hypothetical protein
MNSLKRLKGMKYAALAALAIALGMGFANAQEDVQAKGEFNLPITMRWGMAVLTPGQYSFTYTTGDGGRPLITVQQGTRSPAMILGYVAASSEQFSDPSHLTAMPTSEGYRITSLDLKELGVRLRFLVPSSEVLEASQTIRPARNVPVLRASK